MELFEDHNAPEFSVSEISGAVKRVVEGEFGRVRVRGEVGRVYIARSGHLYFDIKDERSVLACVSWKGQVSALSTRPEEGMEIVATGKMTTFGSQSKYQLNVEDVTPAGEGALMAMLEKRKKALAAEGLFDDARKRALPLLPDVIGVVTSPSGAVIRDILHRLRERFPRRVLVWPVAVQGRDCAPQVAAAIDGFNRLTPGGAIPRPDLIIVARGGGSIEDLWGFNEEIVARAAAASQIPLISAVGHETDTTLIDYVSDRRAPTPTAAAEIAVPVRAELRAFLDTQGAQMTRRLAQAAQTRAQRLFDLERAVPRADSALAARRQRLDMGDARLPLALERGVARRRQALTETGGRLHPGLLRARLTQTANLLSQGGGQLGRSLSAYLSGLRERNQRVQADMARIRAQGLARQRSAHDAAAARLRPAGALRQLGDHRARLGQISVQFDAAMTRQIQDRRLRLDTLDRLRESMGHKNTLRRGFALVRRDGAVLRSATEATGRLEVEFADGTVTVQAGAPSGPRRRKPKTPEQGSLF